MVGCEGFEPPLTSSQSYCANPLNTSTRLNCGGPDRNRTHITAVQREYNAIILQSLMVITGGNDPPSFGSEPNVLPLNDVTTKWYTREELNPFGPVRSRVHDPVCHGYMAESRRIERPSFQMPPGSNRIADLSTVPSSVRNNVTNFGLCQMAESGGVEPPCVFTQPRFSKPAQYRSVNLPFLAPITLRARLVARRKWRGWEDLNPHHLVLEASIIPLYDIPAKWPRMARSTTDLPDWCPGALALSYEAINWYSR